MIFTSLSPNTETDDIILAIRTVLSPWKWIKGDATRKLEQAVQNWLPARYTFAFATGRTSLYAILSSLGLKAEDEVLLQAYTCVAVPDPILWAGAKPVYVDCSQETFTMSPTDLLNKITPESKVLIVQHSFGHPADLESLLPIAKKHNLFVIEDCAHALGALYKGKPVGTFGDASFFSFGRDKVLSSVFGGIAATNNPKLARALRAFQQSLPYPSRLWIIQQLRHLPMTAFAKLTYDLFDYGKVLLWLAQRLRLLSKSVEEKEKLGEKPSFIERKMPNALAILALHQFQKLERFNAHRRKIAKLYARELANSGLILPIEKKACYHIYLRYTIRSTNAIRLIKVSKKNHIELGDWYRTPIAPKGVDYENLFYVPGSCPTAEHLSRESINLPTHIQITKKDARRIIKTIKKIL